MAVSMMSSNLKAIEIIEFICQNACTGCKADDKVCL